MVLGMFCYRLVRIYQLNLRNHHQVYGVGASVGLSAHVLAYAQGPDSVDIVLGAESPIGIVLILAFFSGSWY